MSVDIKAANKKAVNIIQNGKPFLIGVGTVGEDVPGMHDKLILHAGPPVEWENMSGPTQGAVIGALIYEGMAENEAEARELAASGEIEFEPWHEHNGVGPMAGIASASMPVWIVENKEHSNRAYCTFNEGLGKVLRYGAFAPDVIDHLKWMESELAPVMEETLKITGEINLKSMISEALQMGDEVHNRNRAATSLLFRKLAPALLETDFSTHQKKKVLEFIDSNDHFFLNLSMPACKSMVQPAEGIEGCSIVTALARSGTEFGIRVAGLPGEWFAVPSPVVDGLFFSGYSTEDACADIGDSTITETCGLGGFSMAAAPAIVKFVGGTVEDAFNFTRQMYEITEEESQFFQIPGLDFRGAPVGLNILKVCELNIVPKINTGIAHKDAGVGQIGAGLVEAPMEVFEQALERFVEKYAE
ncbi:MAG: DUF1116 domain-containing protein [bacterium]